MWGRCLQVQWSWWVSRQGRSYSPTAGVSRASVWVYNRSYNRSGDWRAGKKVLKLLFPTDPFSNLLRGEKGNFKKMLLNKTNKKVEHDRDINEKVSILTI